MKNKIIIFAVITVMIISSIPLVTSASVADLTIEGNTVTIIPGEYSLTEHNYSIHNIDNENDMLEYEAMITKFVTFTNTALGHLDSVGTFHGLGDIEQLDSIVMNGAIDGVIYNEFRMTSIITTYITAPLAHTWSSGTGTIEGETMEADGLFYYTDVNGSDFGVTPDRIVIKVRENAVTHKEGLKWLRANTNYNEVNSIPSECDGSTCPATDADFNNICDDCGAPLTMSLRNTLYDYALWLAESKVSDGYNYYAIFKSSDTYYVHISKAPMSSPDGTSLEGDGIMYNRVTQSSDGTNGGSGWYNGFYNSYEEFVEANHTISNFKGALPLAEKILGVTEEQLEETLPNLVGILMILMVCGVGCLALLVVLSLFGKRSLIFRK